MEFEILRKIRQARILLRSDRAGLTHAFGLTGGGEVRAQRYLDEQGVSAYLTTGVPGENKMNRHKAYDLMNLHRIVRRLRPRVVIEFGCGYSTLALAHALRLNEQRVGKRGHLHVVEAVPKWAENVRGKLSDLAPYVDIRTPELKAIQLGAQMCHVFADLPNVRPEFIYLDGPQPMDATGGFNGLTPVGMEFPCAADPCFYEWGFYPGFQMLVDGRFTNVEFLKRNLKRKYRITTNARRMNTLFELVR